MPCHHDFFKMSHHCSNTKYGKNTSFIHQEITLRPKTALIFMYLSTFTNLTLNNIQKDVICLFFSRRSRHRASWWWDIPEISKQDSKKLKRSYKLNKNINYMLYHPIGPFLVLSLSYWSSWRDGGTS